MRIRPGVTSANSCARTSGGNWPSRWIARKKKNCLTSTWTNLEKRTRKCFTNCWRKLQGCVFEWSARTDVSLHPVCCKIHHETTVAFPDLVDFKVERGKEDDQRGSEIFQVFVQWQSKFVARIPPVRERQLNSCYIFCSFFRSAKENSILLWRRKWSVASRTSRNFWKKPRWSRTSEYEFDIQEVAKCIDNPVSVAVCEYRLDVCGHDCNFFFFRSKTMIHDSDQHMKDIEKFLQVCRNRTWCNCFAFQPSMLILSTGWDTCWAAFVFICRTTSAISCWTASPRSAPESSTVTWKSWRPRAPRRRRRRLSRVAAPSRGRHPPAAFFWFQSLLSLCHFVPMSSIVRWSIRCEWKLSPE